MMMLSHYAQGRDNNLNLLRICAALAVMFSHAWPFTRGFGAEQPLEAWTGYKLGSLAVAVFFVISGFLIARSFERSGAPGRFLLARLLRIYPALIVNLLFVAFLLGPSVTRLPLTDYFTRPDPYHFVIQNLTLRDLVFTLPGVFEDNPFSAIVGSIWTLYYEVICYGALMGLGLTGALRRRGLATVWLLLFLGVWFALATHPEPLSFRTQSMIEMSLPFAIGTAFYIWRDRLPLSFGLLLMLCALVPLCHGTELYYPSLMLALSYATLWAGFVPRGALRAYNRIGDYSYGVYIYGFPMQGLSVWIFGAQSPWWNFATSLPLTLALAALSWHFVEKPCLRLKPSGSRS